MAIAKVNLAGTEYIALAEGVSDYGTYYVEHSSLGEDGVSVEDEYEFDTIEEALKFIDEFNAWYDDSVEVDVFLNDDLN